MADDVYRPQRKSVPQEGTPEANLNKLEQIKEIARMSEQSMDRDVQQDYQQDDGRTQFTGNIPPKFQEMINKNKMAQQANGMPTDDTLQRLINKARAETTRYDEIQLPSLGKFYDGINGPSDGIVHIREMTANEEQILATPRLVHRGTALDMVFGQCIQENFNTQNFLSQDRIYILIYLRGISYSPEYDVEVRCPFTSSTFSTTIDLNSLPVENCPDDFGPLDLTCVLPKTKFRVSYRLPTGIDDAKIQEYSEKTKKEFDMPIDDTLLYRSSLLINEIEGVSDKIQIKRLLKELPAQDLNHLRNATTDVPFGVNTKIPLISPFTLQEFEAELPIGISFFSPRTKKKI